MSAIKQAVLQVYRLGLVAAVAWLVRDAAVVRRIQGDAPVTVSEVAKFFPEAATLRPDDSERDGLFALDRHGRELGYVVRTQPRCREFIGYSGVTDVLVALDRAWKILGVTVHRSDDTAEHVREIEVDRRFLKTWNGLTWDAVAGMDLRAAGIEGVSGATMTSMAIAESVKARLKMSRDELIARPAWRWGWRDLGLVAVLLAAGLRAFGPVGWRHRGRWLYPAVLILYVGFISGDLIAQKLLAGWARSGVPWTTAPGLVLLVAAALLVPWATRQPLYCHQICPHGAAQEMLSRLRPARWRFDLPPGVARGLEFLPLGLLGFVVLVAMLGLPFDLAGLEPFDAYLVRTAGWATLAVAGVGLGVSFFIPQAYCRFGCPTGALLNFVRRRGATDHFSKRDAAALALLIGAFTLHAHGEALLNWVKSAEETPVQVSGHEPRRQATSVTTEPHPPAAALPAAPIPSLEQPARPLARAAADDREASDSLHTLSGHAMGTTWRVVYRPGPFSEAALSTHIAARLEELEQIFSSYRTESEMSRFNAARTTEWIPVSVELAAVAAASRQLAEQTAGAFDPTLEPLLRLWGFSGSRRVLDGPRPPSPAAVAAARALTGWSRLEIDGTTRLRKQHPDLALNLSSMAKGFAADEVSRRLVALSCADHLVQVGGDVRSHGSPSPATDASRPAPPERVAAPWRVALENGADGLPADDPGAIVRLRGQAVSTSGDYRQGFTDGARRYGHLLDPRTGEPVDDGLMAVTVVAATCAQSSSLATALFVLGPAEGLSFAEQHHIAARFTLRDAAGDLHRRETAAFAFWAEAAPRTVTAAR